MSSFLKDDTTDDVQDTEDEDYTYEDDDEEEDGDYAYESDEDIEKMTPLKRSHSEETFYVPEGGCEFVNYKGIKVS
jgi:hypothetical protein